VKKERRGEGSDDVVNEGKNGMTTQPCDDRINGKVLKRWSVPEGLFSFQMEFGVYS
jgi:hypothetical protein